MADENDMDDRLSRIAPVAPVRVHNNKSYSRKIKALSIVLPIIALGLLLVTFNWNRFQDEAVTPVQERAEEIVKTSIGKNELLNPRFESVDDKNQPYTITAVRAVQGEQNEDKIILESPNGEMTLNSGERVSVSARMGDYRQNAQRLFLQDDVTLFYDGQYEMQSAEMYIDMIAGKAWNDVDVYAQGPEGTLQAKGLEGSSSDGTLVFKGPARLVLMLDGDGLDIGGLAP